MLQLQRILFPVDTLWVVGQEQRRGTKFYYPNALCNPLKMRYDSTHFVTPVNKMPRDSTHFVTSSQNALRLHLHRISLSDYIVWCVRREQRCGTAVFYPNTFCYPLTN